MKIIMVTDVYKPVINGVSFSTDIISTALRNDGHEVIIISPQYPHYTSEKDHLCLWSFTFLFDKQQRVALPLPRPLIHLLKKTEWDIIHIHTPFSVGLLGLWLGKNKKAIKIFTYHTIFEEYTHYIPLPKKAMKWVAIKLSYYFCNACDGVIAPSLDIQSLLLSYGVKKPIFVLPTPISSNDFDSDKNISPYENNFNCINKSKICLYVGRLAKEKNLEFLLLSFKRIHHKNNLTKLILIGNGPYMGALKKLVTKLELEQHVFFVGFIPRQQLSRWYQHAHLFLFTSTTETQGLSLSEALHFGLPAVIVDGPGTRDLITDGINGYIVDCNEEAFSQKSIALLQDDELRKKFSACAKQSVEKLYVRNVIQSLLKIYQGLPSIPKSETIRA